MGSNGITFRHPAAFWLGCLLVMAGVLAHMPMLWMSRHMHWQMAGMGMSPGMWFGMAMIPLGLALSGFGLMPRRERPAASRATAIPGFHVTDDVPLNRAHWALVAALVVALAVDVMKPATLGFVMPGLSAEYAISRASASLLALVALTGTTVGSVVWGRLGDVLGRRAAILLSALMFIGTAICGAMPSFAWNLVMCFLMGASAGGLLPIAFTLMAETVPAAHRGWLLVALGGIGTSAGYLLASGAAALLEPMFSWRILWLLGLPTGAAIIFLNHWIPESPRFLWGAGLHEQARAVLQRFSGSRADAIAIDQPSAGAGDALDQRHPVIGLRQLLQGRHARISWGLLLCGTSWGVANFGFVLWLPTNLTGLGVDPQAASALLARSALWALPGIAVVVWLYHYWSSVRALVLFIALTCVALLAFGAMSWLQVRSVAWTVACTAALLVAISGVIAMLIPYAAEIYPLHLRATGAGVVAASSKFGGILGAGLGVLGLMDHLAWSAVLIAAPLAVSAVVLMHAGIETRGQRLEQIQQALRLQE